jgi:hypothetical protein
MDNLHKPWISPSTPDSFPTSTGSAITLVSKNFDVKAILDFTAIKTGPDLPPSVPISLCSFVVWLLPVILQAGFSYLYQNISLVSGFKVASIRNDTLWGAILETYFTQNLLSILSAKWKKASLPHNPA